MAASFWEALAFGLSEPAWHCSNDDRVVWVNPAGSERCGQVARGREIIAALAAPLGSQAMITWDDGLAGEQGFTVDIAGWQVQVQRTADGWSAVACQRKPAPSPSFDAMPWPMALVDGQHRYRQVNRAYETWFRRPADRVVGRSLASVMGDAQFLATLPRLDDVRRGEPMSFVSELPFPDGQVGSSRVDLQACKLEYSIVSPK